MNKPHITVEQLNEIGMFKMYKILPDTFSDELAEVQDGMPWDYACEYFNIGKLMMILNCHYMVDVVSQPNDKYKVVITESIVSDSETLETKLFDEPVDALWEAFKKIYLKEGFTGLTNKQKEQLINDVERLIKDTRNNGGTICEVQVVAVDGQYETPMETVLKIRVSDE